MIYLVINSSYIDIQKTWIPTAVVPRIEAFALPFVLDRQLEAHAEYKYHSHCCIHVYIQQVHRNQYKGAAFTSPRTSIVAKS